jgi:hypothetical protein
MDGDLVKVTLKGRLHSSGCSGEPRSRSLHMGYSALRAEGLADAQKRAEEDLVRRHRNQRINQDRRAGVRLAFGLRSRTIHELDLAPFHTRRIGSGISSDGNDDGDDADTPMVTDVQPMQELYIRAACEAFVDGRTSAKTCAQLGKMTLYGFTFENLCFRAFGGRWFSTIGSAPSEFIGSEETRPDKPQGFGYLQQTYPFAEVAAQMSKAINLLTRFRVMIPATLPNEDRDGLNGRRGSANEKRLRLPPAQDHGWPKVGRDRTSRSCIMALGAPAISSWSTWTDSDHEIVTTSASLDPRVWAGCPDPEPTANPVPLAGRRGCHLRTASGVPGHARRITMVVAAVDRTLTVFQQSRSSGRLLGSSAILLEDRLMPRGEDGNGDPTRSSRRTYCRTVCRIIKHPQPEALPPGVVASVDSVSDPNPPTDAKMARRRGGAHGRGDDDSGDLCPAGGVCGIPAVTAPSNERLNRL